MVHTIQIKRGTRAQIEAAKAAGQLKDGEPYLITDENRIAVGVSSNGYSSFAKDGINSDITSLIGISGGISTADFIEFDLTAVNTSGVGKINWNDTDGTLEFGLKGGNVTLQIGQEQVVRVTNTTGSTIVDGQAVYIVGSTGNHLNVTLAQANTEVTSSKTLAVVTEPIQHNQSGFATSNGLVRNINTSALIEGGAVWLSPTVPGGLTAVRPSSPNHAVLIGWCVRSHANNGSIFVHIANGYELEELHNVKITNPTSGQVLAYNSTTSLWENTTADLNDEKVAVTPNGQPGYLYGDQSNSGVLRTDSSLRVQKDINDSFIELAVANVDFGTF
jgi:hypothetical protein